MSNFNNSKSYWEDEVSRAEAFVQERLPRADHDCVAAKEARLSMAIELLILDRLDTITQRLDK